MFNSAFKKHKIKICFGLPIIIVVSILIFKIYSYPFKPRLLSPDWIESRYNGWEVEHHDLWIATIVDVVGPKTVKIRNQNGEEKAGLITKFEHAKSVRKSSQCTSIRKQRRVQGRAVANSFG